VQSEEPLLVRGLESCLRLREVEKLSDLRVAEKLGTDLLEESDCLSTVADLEKLSSQYTPRVRAGRATHAGSPG
jgi:hypothetical protein